MSTVAHDVTVVIPARNEAPTIGAVIAGCRPHCARVLVVDGHSTDGTRDHAVNAGADVILDGGRGKGDAIRTAIPAITTPFVVFIDADGSHETKDIPALVAPIASGQADLVIASRGKGGSDELHGTVAQFIRYTGSQLIMLAINYRWNVRLSDSQNGFRAIRREVALALNMQSDLTTIEQEMLMLALKRGYRVTEVASHEYERRWGVSKVSVSKLWWAYLWSFWRNIF